jgi:repressor LexA
MQNLTKRQREVFDWIAGFIREKGYAPSYDEIGEGLELNSLATICVHLHTLRAKGWINFSDHRARSIELTPEAKVRAKYRKEVHCPACQHEFRVGA